MNVMREQQLKQMQSGIMCRCNQEAAAKASKAVCMYHYNKLKSQQWESVSRSRVPPRCSTTEYHILICSATPVLHHHATHVTLNKPDASESIT